MKIVRYIYYDGTNRPEYIIDGGYFYHTIDNEPYLIGVANDTYNSPTLSKNDLFVLTEGTLKNPNDLENPIYLNEEERWELVNNFIDYLNSKGYNINIE